MGQKLLASPTTFVISGFLTNAKIRASLSKMFFLSHPYLKTLDPLHFKARLHIPFTYAFTALPCVAPIVK